MRGCSDRVHAALRERNFRAQGGFRESVRDVVGISCRPSSADGHSGCDAFLEVHHQCVSSVAGVMSGELTRRDVRVREVSEMAVLPDVLRDGLDVVFCGTAAGSKSAREEKYYAQGQNKFWEVLADAGFVPARLKPSEFWEVLEQGIGLTDLNKEQSGHDKVLSAESYDKEALVAKVREYRPRVLAFTSKRAAEAFYECEELEWGRQRRPVGETIVWVLPSTSITARRHWARLKRHWYELAEFLSGGEEVGR